MPRFGLLAIVVIARPFALARAEVFHRRQMRMASLSGVSSVSQPLSPSDRNRADRKQDRAVKFGRADGRSQTPCRGLPQTRPSVSCSSTVTASPESSHVTGYSLTQREFGRRKRSATPHRWRTSRSPRTRQLSICCSPGGLSCRARRRRGVAWLRRLRSGREAESWASSRRPPSRRPWPKAWSCSGTDGRTAPDLRTVRAEDGPQTSTRRPPGSRASPRRRALRSRPSPAIDRGRAPARHGSGRPGRDDPIPDRDLRERPRRPCPRSVERPKAHRRRRIPPPGRQGACT